MFFRVLGSFAALFLLGSTVDAVSQSNSQPNQETALWRNVGTWGVYIDKTTDYRCFIATLYEDNTVFRVGFQGPTSNSALYVSLGNVNWTSIEAGKDYDLILQIDNEAGWPSPATGFRFGSIPALVIGTNQTGFVDQLMRKHSLRVLFNGRQILNLSLRGSNDALAEMANCQNQVDAYLGRKDGAPTDPFAGAVASPSPKDPFAN
ncbi:MAG: hypothetical protein EOQ75_21960 [Mesorhizobium sp.]|uniref:hypothetical protein n=1 Tax=Mesorhizobium sp. TaxID=1871066 RepID=UPI000FE7673E|nr:hypothetical protein [Mesorhizobium sp.]RWH18169.1 MAG: hypothetical protein EOQ75_21960 [Mesorhizobium sp.]